jgi:hypothetical protein
VLRKIALDSVGSPHRRRNYAKALDDLFRFFAANSVRGLTTNVRDLSAA